MKWLLVGIAVGVVVGWFLCALCVISRRADTAYRNAAEDKQAREN